MATATIEVEVDEEAARAFAASLFLENRRKMQLLLDIRLREVTSSPTRPLHEIMDEIGRNAAERGLTPEILESIGHAG